MKGKLIALMVALLLVPAIAAAQGTGAITTAKGWYPTPLTLVAGSNIMEYSITTQNTGLLPFYGRTLIALSGKMACTLYPSPLNIPGRTTDCWKLEYTSTDYSKTVTLCGGSGANQFEIEVPPTIYEIGASKTATLMITAPAAFMPESQELTLTTSFEDFGTGSNMDTKCDNIQTTTAGGKITLEFIKLVLTIGGLAAILIPLGLAFI